MHFSDGIFATASQSQEGLIHYMINGNSTCYHENDAYTDKPDKGAAIPEFSGWGLCWPLQMFDSVGILRNVKTSLEIKFYLPNHKQKHTL